MSIFRADSVRKKFDTFLLSPSPSDYGYLPSSIGGGACVRDPSVVLEDPCTLGQETYMQSQGLVPVIALVISNTCMTLHASPPTHCVHVCVFVNKYNNVCVHGT